MDDFIKYVNQVYTISDEAAKLLMENLKVEKYKKGDTIISEGRNNNKW